MGIGKRRTKLGAWLDGRGLTQTWLAKEAGLNKDTVSRLCNDEGYLPSGATMRKVIGTLRKVDPAIKVTDLWNV